MKQYKVGDEIKVYEILNSGTYYEDHTGKQVACLLDYGNLIEVPLKSRYPRDGHNNANLRYFTAKIGTYSTEAKHVCTMRITKLKK